MVTLISDYKGTADVNVCSFAPADATGWPYPDDPPFADCVVGDPSGQPLVASA